MAESLERANRNGSDKITSDLNKKYISNYKGADLPT
jgi:hypothetical protein